ncbi:hypothetical protein CHGG_01036 [Chaetomium globosum CBS 148.51]|uniref:Sm domain-containing protein n=1 Tax=Chaetomium globosum (strain ATCC 6205 / CBS 148.51 / DSM 1962 / NBRC 6347 / NRRL 1970) TaxID=306901 RepID=Q2HFG8_CHAGB|nr:uncharacterized protein CHGG_01036 [Chaetomium globosum CBS 148.51]EAQ92801.1 hypothetical protein CHGG_01036 [Chaetomium globosum CBS 148.51]
MTDEGNEEGEGDSRAFLERLINKNLRVTTTDSRMFWGTFVCTDHESNLILKHAYEYRHPDPKKVAALAQATIPSPSLPSMNLSEDNNNNNHPTAAPTQTQTQGTSNGSASNNKAKPKDKVTVEMTSRYLGLVVVPGKYVVKIEEEEFASQVRGRKVADAAAAAMGAGAAGEGEGGRHVHVGTVCGVGGR